MKNIIFVLIIGAIIIFAGIIIYVNQSGPSYTADTPETNEDAIPTEPDGGIGDGAEPLPETDEDEEPSFARESTLGTSAGGNALMAYHYGTGPEEIVFIGGIHGGYSANTSLVSYELIDYVQANPDIVPDNLTVTVIPAANPDGLETTLGTAGRFTSSDITGLTESNKTAGRFNANEVDLNRNFDCQWQAEATWREQTVSGGSAPFSEPEVAALRDYLSNANLAAAVVWYSAAGGVYASTCNGTVASETTSLMNTYAEAANYPSYESFDYYEITGDMVNWLAKEGVPAISVLLSNHSDTEWGKNQAGIDAVLNAYAN